MDSLKQINRKIIHIDMDAFFASVEQRDNPSLQNKPIAVGGPEKRGVLATASYEARKFGVKSAMSTAQALRLCPSLIIVYPRFDAYKEVSKQVHQIFNKYTKLIEPLSLDEAYLDVTDCDMFQNKAIAIAKAIKNDIFKNTALTATAGVSYNKFLAKLASGMNKPNGLTTILPNEAIETIGNLSINAFYGIGKKTAEKLIALGYEKGVDLQKLDLMQMESLFGKSGYFYYHICKGIDNRPVVADHIQKSIGIEDTFESDLIAEIELYAKIEDLTERLWLRIAKAGYAFKTVTIKVKYNDFQLLTKSYSDNLYIDKIVNLKNAVFKIFGQLQFTKPVRLLGISVSHLKENGLTDYAGKQMNFPF